LADPPPVAAPAPAVRQDIGIPDRAVMSTDRLRAFWVSEDKRSILGASRAVAETPWGAPGRLLTTRGDVGKIAVAPDGGAIAFENRRTWRGDGATDDAWQFICLFDLATRRLSYVDPVFATDADPTWSADGKAIGFIRKVPGLADALLTRAVARGAVANWTAPAKKPDEAFSLAQVLAAPFIYPPGVSADGETLAYVTREGLSRNVYLWPKGGAARRLVSYPHDDGQEMAEPPALSKTGAALAYVRGGRINRQGDAPNPTADPDPPQQQVWLIGADEAAPRLLGLGHDPVFTPDDGALIWQAKDVMIAPLIWRDGRLAGVGAPETLLLGPRRGLTLSPDGKRLAYERGGGIEVYDLKTRTTAVIPHGQAVDEGPVWSPDGRRLAYRRRSAGAPDWVETACGLYRYCGPLVAAEPWAIWLVDLARLEPQRIWQAEPGVGSVFYPMDQSYSPASGGDQLLWSAEDQIAFVWERDGWRHLYAIPASGGPARRLTAGDGEVESAALSTDRRRIIFSTNIGDLGRRHISAVDFTGALSSVTRGEDASQWSAAPLAGGGVAYVDAGYAVPPRVRRQDVTGAVTTAAFPLAPADFPSERLVKPTLVQFPAADGQTAYGQLFTPEHPSGCAIIFSHGGIKRQMLPGFHYMDAYAYLYEMNQYLAGRGCVVLSVEYRSSIMRGEAFRDAPGWGFSSHSELLDFVGGAKYLLARKDVDPRRAVGVYGLSWGGYMTSQLLARHSDLFKVGFDMAGVHEAPDPAGLAQSAVGAVDTWTSPVFLAQGDDDMNVEFDQGLALARVLQTRRPQVEFKQRVLPGETHDLYLTFEDLVGVYQEGGDFLLSHLGGH
jgi:dipeptidyl aminopeptidase/acylaminoacyl peptidase